jgi:hypothetical protein
MLRELRIGALEPGGDEVVLLRIVAVEGHLRDAGFANDEVHASRREAALVEECAGDVEDVVRGGRSGLAGGGNDGGGDARHGGKIRD